MDGVLKDICIAGISTAVPKNVEKNIDASPFLGSRRCKRQIKLTGIEERRVISSGQKVSDLCYVAARKLLDELEWDSSDIKALVLLTQHPNYSVPSTAFLLQKMLKIPHDCIVFDVNLGCSAFNVGIQIVSSLLNQIPGKAKGLCLIGDLASKTITAEYSVDEMVGNMLFGTAGSVVALEKGNNDEMIPFSTFSDGNRFQAIQRCFGERAYMDGEGIFNFSTNDVPNSIKAFFKKNHLSDKDIDYYVFHQAQKMILDSLIAECGINREKELRSISLYGNTAGASIPLSLCANRGLFMNKENIRVFSCGYGVGLSWSMAYMLLRTNYILPIIESNEVF